MLLVMPRDRATNFSSFEDTVDAVTVLGWLDSLREGSEKISLPKHRLRSSLQLRQPLVEMGHGGLFLAEYWPMFAAPRGLIAIDEIYHDVFVEVDEQGTKASAATGIMMVPQSGSALRFDRPYLFFIYDRDSRFVLFLGRVAEPDPVTARHP